MKKLFYLSSLIFVCLCMFSCITVCAGGDWFCLSVKSGVASDVSANAFSLTAIGNPKITTDVLCLSDGSAYGVTLTDAHNASLADGFSIQTRIYLEEEQPSTGNCDVLGSRSKRHKTNRIYHQRLSCCACHPNGSPRRALGASRLSRQQRRL